MAKPIPIPLVPAEVFDCMMAEEPTALQKEVAKQSIEVYNRPPRI